MIIHNLKLIFNTINNMKLILLRHADRYESPQFLTELTGVGFEQADELVEILPQNIDIIFSSPFLRTIQTIFPYCKKYNKKINIENSLYEHCQSPYFNISNIRHNVSEFINSHPKLQKIYYKDYKSGFLSSNIRLDPELYILKNRVTPFIYKLIHKYKNTNKQILLVTHMSICNLILGLFNKKTKLADSFPVAHFGIVNVDTNFKYF